MLNQTLKALVIGANSVLAQCLINELVLRNQKVVGVFNKQINNLSVGIDYYSIESLGNLHDDFDYVYIISAYIPSRISISESISENLFDSNVALVKSICIRYPNAKIIYASSVSVYGNSIGTKSEDSECNPDTEYAVSKLWGETIVKAHKKYSIVRISSMYGIGMNETTFIPLIINDAITFGRIRLLGDGSRKQNYVHVTDVTCCMILAAESRGNGIYLATSNQSVSNFEVASLICEYVGCEITLSGIDNSTSYYYDNSKTERELSFMTRTKLRDGLKHLIEWKKRKY